MKFGFRIPSIKKRIAARTSWKRMVRHNLGLKAPRGWGWITNPKRAAYNRVYNRTTRGCMVTMIALLCFVGAALFFGGCGGGDSGSGRKATYVKPSVDRRGRFRSGHVRMPVRSDKNAIKNQNRSRYYYHTRGKYSRKKRK